ncbi:MAG TPA: universal stress protein [Rhodocyclaceae bacterium]|nr:universal stress protein [Rhodocyclaceae bacterium]
MYKKILVAIDDSETSQCALEEAKHLARTHGARLCIAHVADETLMGMHHRTFTTTLNLDHARQAIVDAGRKLLDEAAAAITDIETETLALEASTQRVSEALADAAKTWQADLIVVGTHGRRGFERLILGSVAEQLVRLAPVSILLVRKH